MDFVHMLPVFIIMVLVLIVLPIVLGKMSGKNPMEVFFGERVNDTVFGKKKNETDDKSGKKDGKKKRSGGPARNSTKEELLSSVSQLVSYARRNRFYSIVPGTLMLDDEVATFSVIIVTRAAVLGFNSFGYGGNIFCDKEKERWNQDLDGNKNRIDSPVLKNEKQKEILSGVLKKCGFDNTAYEVYGVFTSPSAVLKNRSGTDCYTQKDMMNVLQGDRYLRDQGVDVQKVGKALEKYIKKA